MESIPDMKFKEEKLLIDLEYENKLLEYTKELHRREVELGKLKNGIELVRQTTEPHGDLHKVKSVDDSKETPLPKGFKWGDTLPQYNTIRSIDYCYKKELGVDWRKGGGTCILDDPYLLEFYVEYRYNLFCLKDFLNEDRMNSIVKLILKYYEPAECIRHLESLVGGYPTTINHDTKNLIVNECINNVRYNKVKDPYDRILSKHAKRKSFYPYTDRLQRVIDRIK